MRNFGRFTLQADSAALKSQNPHDKVSDQQLLKSINDLGLAISCARAVIDSPKDDLLPTCTKVLDPKAFDEYVTAYVRLMKEFETSLIEYQSLFKQVLSRPESDRNFSTIYQHSQYLNKLVDTSHKELFGN